MKRTKIKLKFGKYVNCFKITPCLQITYNGYGIPQGFAIELTWLMWGIGIRFYKD